MGEPCPKKKAGILSGVEGKDSSAAFHSASVLGTVGAGVEVLVVDIERKRESVDESVGIRGKRASV